MKGLPVFAAVVMMCLLIGMLTAVAQLRDANVPLRVFPDDVVRIGSPFPEDDDDEGDDEASDCPPYPGAVPKTGQTECWGWHGFPIDCAGTGQDGEYQAGLAWPDPRFTGNGDGTVTDNLTGLIWMQNANCFGEMNWLLAIEAPATLADGSCGLTDGSVTGDWRLPNVRELESLVDYGQQPALPLGHPFSEVQDSYWSSSTTGERSHHFAWIVRLHAGGVYETDKAYSSYIYVLPVRCGL